MRYGSVLRDMPWRTAATKGATRARRGIMAGSARRLGRTGAGNRRVARSALMNHPFMSRGAGYAMGGPLVGEGRATLGAFASASATFRHIPGQNAIRVRPPTRVPSLAARHGKKVAAAIALGTGYHAVNSRTRGVNRSSGRPNGLYDY